MNKNSRVDIESAKKKYAQIRELHDVLTGCFRLRIVGSPLLERHEPALTDYQHAENVEGLYRKYGDSMKTSSLFT